MSRSPEVITKDEVVLVGVLKDKRDLEILLKEKWYRIPVRYAPVRQFTYLAFYQPAVFGRQGKQIQYYARVAKQQEFLRKALLPDELEHPRAQERYLRVRAGKIMKLPKPVQNKTPRRIFFGFTTFSRLRTSKSILQLYNIPPTEEIVKNNLRRSGIKASAQHYASASGKRYCLDFAIFCKRGRIAVECDNKKAHSSALQRQKDKAKDANLRAHGWRVIRLGEAEIISDPQACISKIRRAIRSLGGLSR